MISGKLLNTKITPKMSEVDHIIERYQRRKNNLKVIRHSNYFYFNHFMSSERELKYEDILRKKFTYIPNIKIIEIGAGSGSNLLFFHRLGILYENIWANELLEERGSLLKQNLPNSTIHIGDAMDLNYKEKFDIVFQSTVFTSILDADFKQKLANKMFEMTNIKGIILWYDFKYNNPNNKDVKGVGKKEIRELFSNAKKIDFYSVTLAPPIGRRIGKLYPFVNFLFPFLRSHLIAVIHK